MEHPTIEGLAKCIDSKETTVSHNSPYEVLREAVTTAEGELVLFADGTGTTGIYSEILPLLKEKLKDNIRLSSFHVKDYGHYLSIPSNELIVKLGEEYGEYLLEKNAGKYYLAGHCFGGLTAMETARYLKSKGVDAQVIMIDSKTCKSFEKNRLLLERGFGHLLHADVREAGHSTDEELLKTAIGKYIDEKGCFPTEKELCGFEGEIGECYRMLSELDDRERMRRLCRTLPNRSGEVSDFELERVMSFYDVFCHSYESVSKYEPRTYHGKLMMLRCRDNRMSFLPVDNIDSSAFINEVTEGSAHVIDIDGDHVSCMFGENGKQVCREVMGFFGGDCFAG